MKFIHQTDGSMNIIVDDVDNYECRDDMSVDVILSHTQVEELIESLPISYIEIINCSMINIQNSRKKLQL
jgi:hypothetical protein